MVTIIGPPGIGKSRLALAAGLRLRPTYADGISRAAQGAGMNLATLPGVIADAVGMECAGSADPLNYLRACLQRKHLLLLLDDLEPAILASSLILDLLAAAPNLTMLATAQKPLRVPGEVVYPLGSLALPAHGQSLGESDAGMLFAQRAARANPGWVATCSGAVSLIEACRLLGGIPLAIELAALHVTRFTDAELGERLRGVLPGASDAPKRVVDATLRWSFARLPEPERTLLERLPSLPASSSASSWRRSAWMTLPSSPRIWPAGLLVG